MNRLIYFIVLIFLLSFSITNLVLIENVKNSQNNNNQKPKHTTFLTIGEAISGISFVYLAAITALFIVT